MKGKCLVNLLIVTLFSLGALISSSVGEEKGTQTIDEFLVGTVLLDEEKVVDLKLGDIAAVILEENPSTGYKWEIIVDPEGVLVEEEKQSFTKTEKKMMGAPKMAVWKFSAKSEGEATLTFRYLRPWEGEESIKETIVFKVRVSK